MVIDVVKLRKEFKDPHQLINTSDGKFLFLREWKPSKPSKSAILILHGITAYSGPYADMVAKPLAKEGYAVFGLDLRGHGLSDGARGDYPSYDRLVKDLYETITHIRTNYNKLILLGHSLGVISSFIALDNCLEKINGLILLSAARKIREGVYSKPSILKTLRILFSSLIFKSKPVIEYYREGMKGLDDPLFNFKYTLRFLRILSQDKIKQEPLNIPVIVGVGDQDELFEIDSAREFFNEIKSADKEFIVIKGAKHADFPVGWWQDLINWLKSKFKVS